MATAKTKTAGKTKKLMVAAIDFGTTYSGWAFSFRHDYKSNPTKVSCKNWCSGKHISLKAPTTVLIQPDGCTLEAFGYEAEDRYADLAEENEHHAYYFFQRFKMMLHNKTNISNSEQLEDDKGKRLPAKRVFSLVIEYLKDSLLEEAGKKLVKDSIQEDEIQWVLTVPAIWNPLAKHFMRKCAVEAGIKSANLVIALEPEAASLYCKYLTIQKQKESSGADEVALATFQPGERYMVVDAGGGTVDIVVHEVCSDGKLKEIYKANGGHWGGTTVDKAFFNFLTGIVGPYVMKRFNDEHKDDYFDLQREFEVKKRTVKPSLSSKVKMKLPVSLTKDEYNEDSTNKIGKDISLKDKVEFKADKVLFDSGFVKGLFNNTNKKIIGHLKAILRKKKVQGTSVIILVGGFAESPMLFEAVRDAFKEQHVLVPDDAGLAVLKGAVIFGHDKSDIGVRVSQYTYGFKMYDNYNPLIHPIERMQLSPDGIPEVRGCFQKLVEKGQELAVGSVSREEGVSPRNGCSGFSLKLFASTNKNPAFVDDSCCFAIGELTVDCITDEELVSPAIVRLMFGETEFEVQAILKATGAVTNATFSFMD